MTCYGSPILINVENNGNDHLTSASDGVAFDFSGSGAPIQTAWTERDSLVGFLVLDRNGNGTIDDGRELFGTSTPISSGSTAANGFEALAELDVDKNGRIDINDGAYYTLQLWFDRNHDGKSTPTELLTLAESRVAGIYTEYRTRRRTDQHGNKYRYEGTAVLLIDGVERPRRIFDVFFSLGESQPR